MTAEGPAVAGPSRWAGEDIHDVRVRTLIAYGDELITVRFQNPRHAAFAAALDAGLPRRSAKVASWLVTRVNCDDIRITGINTEAWVSAVERVVQDRDTAAEAELESMGFVVHRERLLRQ